jgi:hypothetical protein
MLRRQGLSVVSLLVFIVASLMLAAREKSSKPKPVGGSVTNPPTATPAPLPSKLLLGNTDATWGEIYRYEPVSDVQLEPLILNDELFTNLKPWFKEAPSLAPLSESKTNSGYVLKIDARTKLWLKDMAKELTPVVSKYIGVNISPRVVTGLLNLNPAGIIMLLNNILALPYTARINEYYKDINNNLTALRSYLLNKEYAALEGNITYLNSMIAPMNERKLSDEAVKRFGHQLETIERESQQAIAFAKRQNEDASNGFDAVKFEKAAVVLKNDDGIKAATQYLDEYKIASDIHYLALSVRGLSANVMCVLPDDQKLALTRLQATRKQLNAWWEETIAFYDRVEAKSTQIKQASNHGSFVAFLDKLQIYYSTASALHQQLVDRLDPAIAAVQTQIDETNKAILVYVELNPDGSIKAAHKLNS